MIYVLWAGAVLLAVALAIILAAVILGPTSMERAISLDVLTSALICILVVIMAASGRVDLISLIVVLSAVGFVSSTAIARFIKPEDSAQPNRRTFAQARIGKRGK